MSELTVILKDAERTYRQKFLMYAAYQVHLDDADIRGCIEEDKKNFQGNPETVQIKIHMEFS
tara:strand:+ start:485 stop:670 length:186 start_codon:yes stop_codon:yes gene_type:complete